MKIISNAVPPGLLLLAAAMAINVPMKSSADGCFVGPRLVWEWDKHKDINEPTQKAIIVYDAGREDLVLQVKYEGPTDEFGWLVPVPGQPEVKLGSMKCFYELSQYTQQLWDPPVFRNGRHHFGFGPEPAGIAGNFEPPPVKVIETKTVGSYEIAILSTKDTGALGRWLDTNGFYFPAEKADVIDAYVKQEFYFVAVKINTSGSSGSALLSPRQADVRPKGNYAVHLKLASGELRPLQISFASDHCIFPLKISSVNGKPSEVQVYVLSPVPLLEKAELEKIRPANHNHNPAQPARYVSSDEVAKWAARTAGNPMALGEGLFHVTQVSKEQLPDCSRIIKRLADKSWWLTKRTWTFKPEEMNDLEFDPALTHYAKMDGQ